VSAGSRPYSKHAFWKYNWLAHHKRIAALERARVHAHGRLVDVGCGSMPFAPLFEGRVAGITGLDLPGSIALDRRGPDVFARAEALPLRDGSAGTVLAMALLSYVPEPRRMLGEAHRVLAPGGVLIVECVQMSPLWNPPHDYWRFTQHGARLLLEAAGFEVVDAIPVGGLMARVGLSWIAALNRVNRGPLRVLTEIPVRALYAAIQLVFAGLDRVLFDPNEALAHLMVARKPGAPART
jgi:SAM-dependent methyltransferase